jgi:hypothetical protein
MEEDVWSDPAVSFEDILRENAIEEQFIDCVDDDNIVFEDEVHTKRRKKAFKCKTADELKQVRLVGVRRDVVGVQCVKSYVLPG